MPRQAQVAVENNFIGGLKTEFTGLNFPENSVTDTDNCIFDRLGRVTRRKGIDLEDTGTYTTIDRTGGAVSSFVWLNAAGDGHTNLLVVQAGNNLRFYEASDATTSLSAQILAGSIDISSFAVIGALTPKTDECQFAQGNGYLFVFHPHTDPFYVTYDPVSQIVNAFVIDINIRDFEGLDDGLGETQHPTSSLSVNHSYNLGNQGWTSAYELLSSSSITIGTGDKTLTVDQLATDNSIVAGDAVKIYDTTNFANNMLGYVKAYALNSMTITVTAANGAGTLTSWSIRQHPENILSWKLALGFYPNNTEVWWNYKNSSDVFDPSNTFGSVSVTSSRAPNGHYIVDPFELDRSKVSAVDGIPVVSTGGERPSTGAFFSSRVFYSGVHSSQQHSTIFFSKIIENTDDFSKCYQTNDPTSETAFDLLPSDGGVINIQGAGQILKLWASRAALVVFATNGIWMITGVGGNEGLGFTADAYSVNKVSNIKTLSATSFVEIQGVMTWWNIEGIYSLTLSAEGAQVQSTTNTTIASFYQDIPNSSKEFARGVYNPITFVVQWLYRSTTSTTIEERYEYDSILNLNAITQAYYPWSIGDSTLKINGISVVDSVGGTLSTNNVISAAAANVVDAFSNQVIVNVISTNALPVIKYIISKPVGITYSMSLGEEYKVANSDWISVDNVGVIYESHFISGYSVHGEAQKFFNLDWLNIYADTTADVGDNAYTIQGLWDFANSTNAHRWSQIQTAQLPVGNYAVSRKRFRIRGKGMALQLKFASYQNLPFSIIGWSRFETKNSIP